MSELTVTVLIENSAPAGLLREHGLALYLTYRGHAVLLDAGESGAFLLNAERLGLDLPAVELAVLSHGHYDHADGLAAFFAANRTATAYARPHIVDQEYIGAEYIGVNPGLLRRRKKRFDLADGPRQLLSGLWLIPDGVVHEQSLVAETAEGLVIFNSCCHAGAGDIVHGIKAQFPGAPVRALIGGLHLMGAEGTRSLGVTPDAVERLADRLLDELEVAELYTGHCTGAPALALLQGRGGERVHPLTTGLRMEF